MAKIKVLHLSSSRSWGGMEMIVARLAGLQTREGYRVAVAAGCGATLAQECLSSGVEAYPVVKGTALTLSNYFRFRRLARSFVPDIIHVHYSRDLNLAVPAKGACGAKIVFTKHLGSYIAKRDPWHRLIYRGVDRATAISRLIRDNLLTTTILDPRLIDIVYLGTDTQRFSPSGEDRRKVRHEMDIPEQAVVIGMMGRMSYGKGYEDFIKMAEMLSGRDVIFLFIGGYSANEDDYGRKIEETIANRLGQRARLAGFRPDRERYLRAIDIFIFPSYAESFGLALTEAMACGLPCLAYGKDGVLDIIDDRQDGLLAQARDIGDLARKAEELYRDKNLRIELGRAARDKVKNKFSERQMMDGFEESYRQALEGR